MDSPYFTSRNHCGIVGAGVGPFTVIRLSMFAKRSLILGFLALGRFSAALLIILDVVVNRHRKEEN